MYPLPLEAFACLEVCPLGHDGSVLLSVVAQVLLTFCVQVLLLFFSAMPMTTVRGSPGLYVLDSVLKSIVDVELAKEVFTFRAR
jgi:hypothetical protein